MHSEFDRSLEIVDRVLWDFPYWRLPRRPTVRILMVVDGSVGVERDYFFGIGKIIEILHKSVPHNDPDFSYVRFDVEIASRDAAPIVGTADYNNFRFDDLAPFPRHVKTRNPSLLTLPHFLDTSKREIHRF
jgi:hypothetical protein